MIARRVRVRVVAAAFVLTTCGSEAVESDDVRYARVRDAARAEIRSGGMHGLAEAIRAPLPGRLR